jgi:hypothetical protein
LFDLDQNNFTEADNVPYNAGTNTGNRISWAATLNYETSGGHGITFIDLPGFGTNSGEEHDQTYQSEGGQVNVTASTTASDGSTVQDCLTYYIDGPQGGITNGNITTQVETSNQSYPSSNSYPSDGTGTQGLMAQVAVKESFYAQFQTPALCNGHPDLWSLDATYSILAKWPDENGATSTVPQGEFIGLMQVGDPFTDADAWDWTVNAQDGVNKFSGGSKRVDDFVQDAVRFEGYIRNGYSSRGVTVPAHKNADGSYISALDAVGKESNALVLYAGDLKKCSGDVVCTTNSLYWFPECSGTVTMKSNTATCSTSWQWAPNTSNQLSGLLYVSNNQNDSWHDQYSQPGVRDDLK